MKATIIRMGEGFFIPKLDGFDDIQKDIIDVNIDLQKDEVDKLSYKELRGIAILENYYEKLQNQIEISNNITDIQKEFREKNSITMTLDEYLNEK